MCAFVQHVPSSLWQSKANLSFIKIPVMNPYWCLWSCICSLYAAFPNCRKHAYHHYPSHPPNVDKEDEEWDRSPTVGNRWVNWKDKTVMRQRDGEMVTGGAGVRVIWCVMKGGNAEEMVSIPRKRERKFGGQRGNCSSSSVRNQQMVLQIAFDDKHLHSTIVCYRQEWHINLSIYLSIPSEI